MLLKTNFRHWSTKYTKAINYEFLTVKSIPVGSLLWALLNSPTFMVLLKKPGLKELHCLGGTTNSERIKSRFQDSTNTCGMHLFIPHSFFINFHVKPSSISCWGFRYMNKILPLHCLCSNALSGSGGLKGRNK